MSEFHTLDLSGLGGVVVALLILLVVLNSFSEDGSGFDLSRTLRQWRMLRRLRARRSQQSRKE